MQYYETENHFNKIKQTGFLPNAFFLTSSSSRFHIIAMIGRKNQFRTNKPNHIENECTKKEKKKKEPAKYTSHIPLVYYSMI